MPNNAAIILVGDITLAEVPQHAERLLGAWEPGTLPARAVPEAAPLTQTHVYILDKPGTVESVVMVGNTGIRRADPSYYAFVVLQSALGGKFQSRINLNLREDKGYTYGARTFFRTPLGAGPFAVIAAVQRQSTDASLVEILNDLRDLPGPRPLSEAELAQTKSHLIKRFPSRFQRLRGVADQLAQHVIYNLPDDEWTRYASCIQSITSEQVTRTAIDLINPDASLIVVVGDREKIEAGIRGLSLGEMHILSDAIIQ